MVNCQFKYKSYNKKHKGKSHNSLINLNNHINVTSLKSKCLLGELALAVRGGRLIGWTDARQYARLSLCFVRNSNLWFKITRFIFLWKRKAIFGCACYCSVLLVVFSEGFPTRQSQKQSWKVNVQSLAEVKMTL